MKNIIRLLTVAFLIVSVTEVRAEKRPVEGPQPRNLKQTTAGCTPSSTYAWLNINNARVRVNAGGDMWWDLPGGSGAKYYIPANGSATSLYAGSLWIAGMDINNQLKCAAIRFRQVGNDFWTGPLTVDGTASIDAETCMEYDKMYNITREEVDQFLAHCDENGIPQTGGDDNYEIPANILNWPAHGDPTRGMSYYLAPFYDNPGKDGTLADGIYDPTKGDYPYYDIDNSLCHEKNPTRTMEEVYMGTIHGSILSDQVIKGDQTIWWVFNDKGNSHTETGGSAIGMEIRAQAFAFSTNDEINNMTFYSYEIINRSTYTLTNTYFSPWTDVDLGFAKDDYVGCDVSRGLGYGYNGANVDGNGETEAYGANPPAVGVDFFQGPYLDNDYIDNPKYEWVDTIGYTVHGNDTTWKINHGDQLCDESINGVNFGNGIVDDERYGMRRFVYHDNTGSSVNGDPEKAAEYYLLLRGIWKNGAKMQYGGTAVPGAAGTVGPDCDFMFPFDSDPCNWGTHQVPPGGGFNTNGFYWSEETGNNGKPNPVNDRRFMQSAGPFTLKSGAVNYITFGVPWARANTGKAWASVELLRKVDDKCQSMFDNCFKVLDGPNAPDITIQELDRKLIVYLTNSKSSNNEKEDYSEMDIRIPDGDTINGEYVEFDKYYRFEGYMVYQLANAEVSVDQLSDNTKARLVFQCDIKNNVSRIINFIYDDDLQQSVPTLMVDGSDNGITHSFEITMDQFTKNNDPSLVNHHTYYFMAIAYAYNNYLEYVPETSEGNGQKEPYLAGRKNIKIVSAIPHKIVNGTVLNSSYGDKPVVQRWTGIGNGGNQVELSDADVEELLKRTPASSSNIFGMEDYPVIYHPTFKRGYGPINVKIVDPLNVKPTDYALWFDDFKNRCIEHVTGDAGIPGDTSSKRVFNWYLKDLIADTVYKSDTTTELSSEKLFLDLGISVNIEQSWNVGPASVGTRGKNQDMITLYANLAPKNGVITSSVTYADSSNRWLSGIRDTDATASSPLNWIRSGNYADQDDASNNDYAVSSKSSSVTRPFDPGEDFEKIAEGTWAPYILTSVSVPKQGVPGPVLKLNSKVDTVFFKIGSIDIVLTADKEKWTRCPVIEMCLDENLSENGGKQFGLRRHPSVNKDGEYAADTYNEAHGMQGNNDPNSPAYISAYGMGWFPGYAIDIETGSRMNIAYGEDSYYASLNGRDMLFNPPALMASTAAGGSQNADTVLFDQVSGKAIFGAKHYVYIFPMNDLGDSEGLNLRMPAYDAGRKLFSQLEFVDNQSASAYRTDFWKQPTWVGMPMAIQGKEWLPKNNPVKISVRLMKPYLDPCQKGKSYGAYGNTSLDITASSHPDRWAELCDTENHKGFLPYYTFSTKGYGPTYNDAAKGESDLDLIQVVPNPYYAYSNYEPNALTHRVKIANLPDKCVVTIYSVNGTKIRQFKKDDPTVTSIDWDLTNHANTPIASGIYIIHVKDNVNGGEKTVKFYCAMRQVDLNTF